MKSVRPEDLGSMGESFFKTLCKSAGFIANKSDDDKGGWDFEIEHPKRDVISYSNQSYPVYRIQVKSTKTGANDISVSYSNLLNLIQYSGASFMVLAKYSDKITPDTAYLFHIDENFAENILKEIRIKHVANEKFKINKRKRIVKLVGSHEILPLNGLGLKSAFEKHIGDNYLKYVERKVSYLTRLEKDGGKREFAIKINGEKNITSMVNSLLGYEEQFKIDSQTYNAPFGIRDKTPVGSVEDGMSTFRPGERPKATIYLSNSKFGIKYQFSGVIYATPKHFPRHIARMRLKTSLFDILINPNDGALSFESFDIFSADIKVSFRELYNYFCYVDAMKNGADTYLRVESPGYEKPLELCLSTPGCEVPSTISNMFAAIVATYRRVHDLNLEDKTISTRFIWDHFGYLNLLNIVNQKYSPPYILEFEHRGADCADATVVVFKSFIKFEEVTLGFISAFYGEIERIQDNVHRGRFYQSELLGEYVLGAAANIDEALKDEFVKCEEDLVKKGFKILN